MLTTCLLGATFATPVGNGVTFDYNSNSVLLSFTVNTLPTFWCNINHTYTKLWSENSKWKNKAGLFTKCSDWILADLLGMIALPDRWVPLAGEGRTLVLRAVVVQGRTLSFSSRVPLNPHGSCRQLVQPVVREMEESHSSAAHTQVPWRCRVLSTYFRTSIPS